MNFKESIEAVAGEVNFRLNPKDKGVGFIIIALPLGEDNPKSVWVSNMERPDVVGVLKQVADKTETEYLDNLKRLN